MIKKCVLIGLFALLINCAALLGVVKTDGINNVVVSQDMPVPSGAVVLIEKDGKPLLTEAQFNDFLDQVINAEPQIAFYMQMDPDGARSKLLEAKLRELIIGLWADEQKIREQESYKKQYEIGRQALDSMLVQQMFIESNKKEVSEKEVRAYYDQFKGKDPDLGTAGGVKAKGVKFEDQAKADAFVSEVTKTKHDIDKAAKSLKNLKVRDFGLVSKDGFWTLDQKLKDGILATTEFPSVAVSKVGDKEVWVFVASEKKLPEYEPFDQVKDGIKQKLSVQSIEKIFEEKVPALAQEKKVVAYPSRLSKISVQKDMNNKDQSMVDAEEDLGLQQMVAGAHGIKQSVL
jgi:hypothetical protein